MTFWWIRGVGRPYHFKLFKGCLPPILLGLFLNSNLKYLDPYEIRNFQVSISTIFKEVQYTQISFSNKHLSHKNSQKNHFDSKVVRGRAKRVSGKQNLPKSQLGRPRGTEDLTVIENLLN